ncbi:hypothetical protein SNE510_60720 [Streptomyces sp. NE5-10]|uniref:ParB/RepB/Spo0J family partition protein n=1 Tax=Streptomyces sp. NE5-10 TaxID=2759674 RepID=UPI00190777B3|nr:hypothetical protein [Streptomyces sp. NE5-10]GHJ96553.1 hypothetical protein SNE510_60720 [Streptomyces sp. NE5-10]
MPRALWERYHRAALSFPLRHTYGSPARVGDDDDKLDEAVVIENIHRKNIPAYEEAEFWQRMVERHGSQEKVAERIGKSQMCVSHRLALLNPPPELRHVVDTRQVKVKTAEEIARPGSRRPRGAGRQPRLRYRFKTRF